MQRLFHALRRVCLALVISILLIPVLEAQISRGGTPLKSQSGNLEWIELEKVQVEELLLEDEWFAVSGRKNNRIAKELQVRISPLTHGNWEQQSDGTTVWRVGLRGQGARALGLVFRRYRLENGSRLYIYDPSGKEVLGAYTSFNNKLNGSLPVSYLHNEELIVQLELPPGDSEYGELEIGTVRWAYLPVPDGKSSEDIYYGKSGDCNTDINCALGDNWQVVKNAVVRIITNEKCSGVMINNTALDTVPYLYTAAHCVFDGITHRYKNPLVYFNYESPTCDGPDGSTEYSISGATLIATGDTLEYESDADSLDFALLRLSVSPPDSFRVYYAGWNRVGNPPQQPTAIHHPFGDVKKIALDQDVADNQLHAGDYWDDEGLLSHSFWRVLNWEEGTTEGGSSGCPLFDKNQYIVGTLTGGIATCSNPVNDYFTRFDYAWDYYPEPSKQLKCWLDPGNTGALGLAGMPGYKPDGIFANTEIKPLRLFPNPASDHTSVEADLSRGQPATISVYDMKGMLVYKESIVWEGSYRLSTGQLSEGLYVLQMVQHNSLKSGRFIISR